MSDSQKSTRGPFRPDLKPEWLQEAILALLKEISDGIPRRVVCAVTAISRLTDIILTSGSPWRGLNELITMSDRYIDLSDPKAVQLFEGEQWKL